MRNLQQYPITRDEKINALNHAIAAQQAEAKIGDIRPAALTAVLRDLTDDRDTAEPVIKDLDWKCGNWWYANTIIGRYEYKNWHMDQSGPAWLHFPDGTSEVHCQNIDEARVKAMAHFSKILITALVENPAVVSDRLIPSSAGPSENTWQGRLSKLVNSLADGDEIELSRIMVKVNPPSIEDLTEEIKKMVIHGSAFAVHRIYSPTTRIPLADYLIDIAIPAEFEDEWGGETVKIDHIRDVELIVSAPSGGA